MRWKIIIVNSAIWIVLGGLAAMLLTVRLEGVLSNPAQRKSEAERAVRSASMQLELEGLRLERWLAARATEEDVSGVFAGGTLEARAENASVQAKRLRDAAAQSAETSGVSIPIVLFLDPRGVVVGRNDSSQMRGEDLARAYPGIASALSSGQTSSQVWLNRQRSEQLLVSCAPIRGEAGEVLGALVAGAPLNDERLGSLSQATSGLALAVAVTRDGAALELIAAAEGGVESSPFAGASERGLPGQAALALSAGRAFFEDGSAVYAAEPLSGYDAGGGRVAGCRLAVARTERSGAALATLGCGRPRHPARGGRCSGAEQLPGGAHRSARGRLAVDHERPKRPPLRHRAPRPRWARVPDQLAPQHLDGSARDRRGRPNVPATWCPLPGSGGALTGFRA